MARMLDLITRVQRGELPPPPVASLIGFHIVSIEPGHAVMAMEAGPQHANPMGTLHGGILCDLADAAMGMAYAASLDEDETFRLPRRRCRCRRPASSRFPGLPDWRGRAGPRREIRLRFPHSRP